MVGFEASAVGIREPFEAVSAPQEPVDAGKEVPEHRESLSRHPRGTWMLSQARYEV